MRRVLPPLVACARNAASSLADVLTDPVRVIGLIGGSTGVTSSFILTLAAAVAAFGGGVSFPEIGAALPRGGGPGSAAPTPGGLGAVEAALVTASTGYGMASGPAVSAAFVPPGDLLAADAAGVVHVPADAAERGVATGVAR